MNHRQAGGSLGAQHLLTSGVTVGTHGPMLLADPPVAVGESVLVRQIISIIPFSSSGLTSLPFLGDRTALQRNIVIVL